MLADVRIFRSEVQQRRAQLKHARARQAELVAERAASKASIESRLAERQRMLSSIRSEIASIRAAEQRRQAELERQARARLNAPQPLISTFTAPAEQAPSVLPDAPPAKYGGVVGIAMQYLGIPYVYGGSTPRRLRLLRLRHVRLRPSRRLAAAQRGGAQYGYGIPVDRSQLQPGDLVFFNGLGHNGIYIGGGQFIHSPHTGDVVKISSMSGWYDSTFVGARGSRRSQWDVRGARAPRHARGRARSGNG